MPYIGNIVQDFSVNTAMLNTDSVTSIKIDDGTIVNADINDSAAIQGSKISPNFGSQDITTTGDITANNINANSGLDIAITSGTVSAIFPNNSQVNGITGMPSQAGTPFVVGKDTGSNRSAIFAGNVATGDLAVTGPITGTGDLTIDTNTLHVDSSNNRVGIGTTSPTGILEIDSSSTTEQLMFDVSGTNYAKIGHNTSGGSDLFDIRSEGHARILTNGNNTAIFIKNDQNVGIGTSTPSVKLDVSSSDSTAWSSSNLSTALRVVNSSATNGVGAGIQLRTINNAGTAGIQYIHCVNSSTNYTSDLVFSRRKADTTYAEACRITNAGDVEIADGNLIVANGHGIDFSATGNSSGTMQNELLDDYEEGSWTATMHDGNGSNVVLTSQDNKYTKIGRLLIVTGNITLNDTGKSGGIVLTNLPFTAGGFSQLAVGHFWVDRSAPNVDTIGGVMYATASNTSAYFVNPTGGASGGGNADDRYFQFADWANGRHIYFSLTYQTA
jgi:hypothetical protein